MENIKIEREAIVLDEEERGKLYDCLIYCLHRIKKHGKGRMQNLDENFIDYLLSNLNT